MTTDLIEPEKISPEGYKVAMTYLSAGGNMEACARDLNMDILVVEDMLNKREVQRFIDRIYNETGYRNRFKIAEIMDEILRMKLEEMDETGLGTSKDIVDLIETMHKMKMKELEMQIKLEEARNRGKEPAQQTNIQINNGYTDLVDKLMGK